MNLTARQLLAISLLAVVLVVVPLLGLHAAATHLAEMQEGAISDVVSDSHERVAAGLESEYGHLLRSLEDWSAWDAMYNFALEPTDQAWREENFSPDTVATLGMSRIALHDRQGKLILHTDYDHAAARPADFGADALAGDLTTGLAEQSDLTFQRGGLCMGPDGTLSWAAIKPIRKSDRSGPIAGFLMMVRPLGDSALKGLQRTTGMTISQSGQGGIRSAERVIDDTGRCSSYVELRGWDGSPLGYLSVGTPLHGILERQEVLREFLLRLGIVAYVILVTSSLLAASMAWGRSEAGRSAAWIGGSGSRIPVGLTAIAGLVLTATGMWSVRGWQREVHQAEFDRRAGNCVEQVHRAIESRMTALGYLQSYFHSSEHVEQQEFDRLIHNAGLSLAGTRQWAWLPMPRCDGGEKDIREIDLAGIMSNPPASTESFSERLASWRALGDSIERARTTGQITSVVVPFEPEIAAKSHRIALLAPVYHRGIDTMTEHRRRDFRGVLLCVIEVDDVVADSAAYMDSGGVTTTVAAVTSRPHLPAAADDQTDGHLSRLCVLPVGQGLSVDLRIVSESRFNYGLQNAVPAGVATGGVVLTALLCAFMELTLQRTRRIEQLVAVRTRELEAKTAELTSANIAAQAATQTKSAFLANMSHELRTPMTAILGYTDLLTEPQHSGESHDEFVRTIRGSAEHLLTLINDVLDLSKIEAGRMQVERIECNPAKLIAEVLTLLRGRATHKGLVLEVEYTGEVPDVIQTDPTRFRQILVNLVGNAVKFTDSGGVRLLVKMATARDLDEPVLGIEVIDTGPGIDESTMQRLFEPFEQGDGSTTRKYGGTGLGLSISRHLAQLLGGSIQATSVQGEGSSFRFTLATGSLASSTFSTSFIDAQREVSQAPAWTAASVRTADLGTVDAGGSGGTRAILGASGPILRGRILLAEDTIDNQRLLNLFLHKLVEDVTVVCNGHEAIEKALESREEGRAFDLILMDIQMPILDGYAATRGLRNAGWSGPIIALTAHASAMDRERCIDAGCDEVMTKPVQREAFLAMCRAFIEGGSPGTKKAA